ncbi:MAG: DUF2510 domain-containing protein [Propionibacteriaceae bacterium]|nr:DUF2510 domain-containing protein [Propionibacteriaceae bacterium]
MSTPPNWYPDPQNTGALRWWDGTQWTEQVQPNAPLEAPQRSVGESVGDLIQRGHDTYQDQMNARAAMETAQGIQCRFEAHVAGINATVTVYQDRIEYMKPKDVSGGKVAAAVMTVGLSLLATGVKSQKSGGVTVMPIRQVASVTSRNESLRYAIMYVTSTGGSVLEFRGLKADIANAMAVIMRLVNNGGTSGGQSSQPQVVVNVAASIPAPAPTAADPHSQLLKLKSLLDAGVLTQAEYDAKRATLVAQL